MKKRIKSPENLELFALEYTASTAAIHLNPEDQIAKEEQSKALKALKNKMPGTSDAEIQIWSLNTAKKSLAQEKDR